MMQITGYRVLVKPDEVQKKSKGGIYLAQDEKLEKTGVQKGMIISIGPSAWKAFREMDDKGKEHNGDSWAQPGDYVLFARNAGRFVYDPFESYEDNKNEYLVMNDEDIIAIIKEGENPTFDNEIQKKAQEIV